MVSRDLAATGAFTCLDHLQQEAPEVQVAAASILFAAWSHRLGLDPHDLYQQGLKMLRPQMGHLKANVHMEVLRDFAGIRLAGDPSVDVR